MLPDGWKNIELKKLTSIYDGTHFTPNYVESGVPFYSVENLTGSNFSKTKFIAEEVYERENKRVKLERGDILMTKIGDIGTAVHLNWDVRASFYVSLALIKSNLKFDSSFLTQYINSNNFYRELWQRIIHVAFPKKINLGEIGKCRVLLPPLNEQIKIAEILSAWDKSIHINEKLLSNSQNQRKALMQQLLTGKKRLLNENGIRFKGKWKKISLGELTKIYDGTHSTPNYVEKGIPFYSVEHLTRNDFSKTKFISEDVYERENKRVTLEKNDILMTRIGDIGTAKHLNWGVKASFYVSLALIKSGEKFDSEYLTQYINSHKFQAELWKRTIHVAFPKKINLGEIGNCLVELPSIEEQRKIATVLFSADQEIDKLKRKLIALKIAKKALMQQLLTGNRRVKI